MVVMHHGLAHDPHPDDAETERLLGLLADAMRDHAAVWEGPDGETEAEREARLERLREVQRRQSELEEALNGLHLPVKGVDYVRDDGRLADPMPAPQPSELLRPIDFRAPIGWPDPTAVAEKIISAAGANTKYVPTGTKIDAARLVAHHILKREALPEITVCALSAAMAHRVRVPSEKWPGIDEAVEAARLATASPKIVVRNHRKNGEQELPATVERDDKATVIAAVRWLSEQGLVLYGPIFHYIVVALGLTDGRGGISQSIREEVVRSRNEVALVGVLADGRFYGPKDDLPDSAADAEFVWGGLAPPRLFGTRHREDDWDAAVRIEADARIARGTHAGTRALPYEELAKRLRAEGRDVDAETLRRWATSRAWKKAVLEKAVWPIWNTPKKRPV